MIDAQLNVERPYESLLDEDFNWALLEGSLHFEERNRVHQALRKITARLNEHNICYAVIGAMAMFKQGYRRFTENVDYFVTGHALSAIHRQLDGQGYVRPHRFGKKIRDAELGVSINFRNAGDYPGDGKPKPVAFPDPSDVAVDMAGIDVVDLKTLVELKLASGISGADRLKDLADVQELIKLVPLREEFASQLHPYVRPKFMELLVDVSHAAEANDER